MPVKEKKVELIELFYDLIFVYAISRLTSLISEPLNGGLDSNALFVYVITSFVILQAWLYFTNYVNRYGEWNWYEYLIACINMISVIYMANTISANWVFMYLPFNLSMLIMLLTVLSLYLVLFLLLFEDLHNSSSYQSIISIACCNLLSYHTSR